MLHLNLFNVLMLPCKRSVVCLKIFCWVWSHTKYHGFFFCSHLWRAYLHALSMDFTTHLKLQRGLCSSLVFWTIFRANLFWLPPKEQNNKNYLSLINLSTLEVSFKSPYPKLLVSLDLVRILLCAIGNLAVIS